MAEILRSGALPVLGPRAAGLGAVVSEGGTAGTPPPTPPNPSLWCRTRVILWMAWTLEELSC